MIKSFDLGSVRLHDVSFTTRSFGAVHGLTGLPSVRGVAVDRPEDDGATEPLNQFSSPRIVTVEGETWASTIDLAWTDWDAIAAAFEAAQTGDVLATWETGTTPLRQVQGYCRLTGDVLPDLSADDQGAFIRYQAQLRFSDPRWYSQTLQAQSIGAPTVDGGMPLPIVFPIPFGSGSSGGQMTVVNNGKTKTWPTLTVTGPISSPVVENTTLGRALYFAGLVLGAGQQLIIETNPRTPRSAKVSGASVIGSIDNTTSKWWWLDPGTSSIRFYGAAGGYGVGTNFAETHRDAWRS